MFAGESHQASCPTHFINSKPWIFVRLTAGSLTKWLCRGIKIYLLGADIVWLILDWCEPAKRPLMKNIYIVDTCRYLWNKDGTIFLGYCFCPNLSTGCLLFSTGWCAHRFAWIHRFVGPKKPKKVSLPLKPDRVGSQFWANTFSLRPSQAILRTPQHQRSEARCLES